MRVNRALVQQVAKILACKGATNPDFMFTVAEELEKFGYQIECRQRGISGTHVIIVKLPART